MTGHAKEAEEELANVVDDLFYIANLLAKANRAGLAKEAARLAEEASGLRRRLGAS